MLNTFLLGTVFAASLLAGLFFLRFWKDTRDLLFLAFACFFFLEGTTRVFQTMEEPSVSPWIYVVRLVALLFILAAIVNKNSRSG